MSYYEYLDADRKRVTRDKTSTTIAKRYVYNGNVNEFPHRQYVGQWRPTEDSQVSNGVIVSNGEVEADDSRVVKGLIIRRITRRIGDIRREIAEDVRVMTELTKKVDMLQRELHVVEDKFNKIRASKSLMDILRIRAERKKK